jgi:hypothetical protein
MSETYNRYQPPVAAEQRRSKRFDYMREALENFLRTSNRLNLFSARFLYWLGPPLFLAAIFLMYTVSWMVMDNAAIAQLVSKGYYVRYIHFALARLMALGASEISGRLPWFAFVLIGVHVASLYLFFASLRDTGKPAHSMPPGVTHMQTVLKFVFACFYLSVYTFCILMLDYTSTAILLGVNACILAAQRSASGRLTWPALMCASAALCGSVMIRTAALKGVLAVAAPLLALSVLIVLFGQRQRPLQRRLAQVSILIAVLIGPAVTFFAGDIIYKSHFAPEAYREYEEFDKKRGKLHRLRFSANPSKRELQAAGWSRRDWVFFGSWIFFDETTFSARYLADLLDEMKFKPLRRHLQRGGVSVREISKRLKKARVDDFILPFLALFLAGFAGAQQFNSSRVRKALIVTVLASAAYPFVLALIIRLTLKLPYRIALPLLLAASGVVWSYVSIVQAHMASVFTPRKGSSEGENDQVPVRSPGRLRAIVTMCLLSLACLGLVISIVWDHSSFTAIANKNREKIDRYNRYHKKLSILSGPNQDGVFLSQPALLQINSPSPFIANREDFKRIPIGWQTFSPHFYDIIDAELGVEKGRDILPAMADHDNAFVIARPYWRTLLGEFAPAGIKLSFVRELSRLVWIYRVERSGPEDGASLEH